MDIQSTGPVDPPSANRSQRADSTFIIATHNRPKDLLRTIESLVGQTTLPGEICIVDASDEPVNRREIASRCSLREIELIYVHPAPRSLTAQRNLGIDVTHGDPVFLIDDDVELAPDCHEAVLSEYERQGNIGGVCASPARPEFPSKLEILYRRLFGIGGHWPNASGKVRRSLHAESVSVLPAPRAVEHFGGWFMSFRRKVFELERFDENLDGYAFKEDLDFSYRVSRQLPLIQTPAAKCHHFKSPGSRVSPRRLQEMHVRNQVYLHKKLMRQDARHKVALYWAFVGQFFFYAAKAIKDRRPGWVIGLITGLFASSRRTLPVLENLPPNSTR